MSALSVCFLFPCHNEWDWEDASMSVSLRVSPTTASWYVSNHSWHTQGREHPTAGGFELVLKLGCCALTTSVDVQAWLRCQYFAGANEIQYLIPFVFKSLGQVWCLLLEVGLDLISEVAEDLCLKNCLSGCTSKRQQGDQMGLRKALIALF